MSRYQMPTCHKVTETIEEAYKLQFQQIKKELNEDADFVNVTTGIWSSRNMGSYIGVTGQWSSKATGELKIRCLAIRCTVCLEAIPVKTSTLISRQCLTSMGYQQIRCLLF